MSCHALNKNVVAVTINCKQIVNENRTAFVLALPYVDLVALAF